MKHLTIFAAFAVAVLAAGCAKNEVIQNESPQQAVTFGVYAGQSATKATYGDITTTNLTTSADGFGVFAYYTQNTDWTSSNTPNFMYNQQVRNIASFAAHSESNPSDYTAARYPSEWYYTPLKYWPNGQNSTEYAANSTSADKVSFFAYAPHIATVSTVPEAGQGITAMSSNSATGAPYVDFTVPSKAEQQIDLLWAIPIMDQTKKAISGRVPFVFKHALSKLNFKVQAVVDATAATTTNLVDNGDGTFDNGETWILLQSLSVTANGTQSGRLTLDSNDATTPNWSGTTGNTTVSYVTSPCSFAPAASVVTADSKNGFKVTETATDLNSSVSPMIIPATIAASGFTIVANYWVITKDTALSSGYSTIQNVITSTNVSPITFAAGKKYDITVKLGLNSVDFTATVTDWDGGASPLSFDLPLNAS